MAPAPESSTTLDEKEVARFAKRAGEWWDADGPFKPLHRINPVRLTYIRDQLCRKWGREKAAAGEPQGPKVTAPPLSAPPDRPHKSHPRCRGQTHRPGAREYRG